MDIRKFTQRSVEAIQGAQSIAIEHNNQQVDEEPGSGPGLHYAGAGPRA